MNDDDDFIGSKNNAVLVELHLRKKIFWYKLKVGCACIMYYKIGLWCMIAWFYNGGGWCRRSNTDYKDRGGHETTNSSAIAVRALVTPHMNVTKHPFTMHDVSWTNLISCSLASELTLFMCMVSDLSTHSLLGYVWEV